MAGNRTLTWDISGFRAGWDDTIDDQTMVCIACGDNIMPLKMVNEAGGVTISQTDYSTLYEITRTGRVIHRCAHGRLANATASTDL
jgi:hypothetical protein